MLFFSTEAFSQTNGRITGVITDQATGDPLPGANIFMAGTAIGTSSDVKGRYTIYPVPPGKYTLRVSYIGYQTTDREIQVQPGKTMSLDIKLVYDVVEGETVTITAQAEGQVAAINQQLRSNTITNVVSAERIMEFPDANAAESVGRLPGISIRRSGGEGNKIVIRGLSPTYNTITVGGERIPATDLDDRSVDLTMISPEILAGIEVVKALTPDKDADTFGGTVDFKLAEAPEGGFHGNINLRQGYNAQREEAGQYKRSITMSDRLLDNKFGILMTGNLESVQRGSDQFKAGYQIIREKREGEQYAPMLTNSVRLTYIDEVRKRSSLNIIMDYRLNNGKIGLSNFFSRMKRSEHINENRFSYEANNHYRNLQDVQRQIDIQSNSLTGEHSLFFADMDWRVSRTASNTRHPYESEFNFREQSAFDFTKTEDSFGPETLVAAALNNLERTPLDKGYFRTEKSFERDWSAQLNLKFPFAMTRNIAGFVKVGGKYRHKLKERDRLSAQNGLDRDLEAFETHHTRYGEPDFELIRTTGDRSSSVLNYLDPDFDQGDFLDGAYDFGPGLDIDEMNYLVQTYLLDSLYLYTPLADLEDYETIEEVSAGYIMAEMNIGRYLMVLPGVRYEYTRANMTGRRGVVPEEQWEPEVDALPPVTDTTATNSYGRWFPMVHLRVRPVSWFDARIAVTRSQVHPRLSWMLPKREIHESAMKVTFGNPELKPQTATNIDLFLSFYGNTIGLFTLGGFYKEIDDLIFNREGHKILNAAKEGYSRNLQGFFLDRPENNPYPTYVRGFEIEWQTNFRWLPKPFDGLVLNANYTHLSSETHYPRSFVSKEILQVYPYVKTTVIDTFRTGNMLDQADDIANLSVGYDQGPVSLRVSMLFQGKTLSNIGERPEQDSFTADLLRWDISGKIRLIRKLDLFMSFNNVTNEPDESYRLDAAFPTQREYYSWTADIGIGYRF